LLPDLHDDEAPGQVAQDEHGDGADEDDGHVGLAGLGGRGSGGGPEIIDINRLIIWPSTIDKEWNSTL
jgi:hypothetical protein